MYDIHLAALRMQIIVRGHFISTLSLSPSTPLFLSLFLSLNGLSHLTWAGGKAEFAKSLETLLASCPVDPPPPEVLRSLQNTTPNDAFFIHFTRGRKSTYMYISIYIYSIHTAYTWLDSLVKRYGIILSISHFVSCLFHEMQTMGVQEAVGLCVCVYMLIRVLYISSLSLSLSHVLICHVFMS